MVQKSASIPSTCLVTGGSGIVGQRLVEMLVDRGAKRVVSFDIAPKPAEARISPEIVYVKGDITKYEDVKAAATGCDCVFHIAALVRIPILLNSSVIKIPPYAM